MYSNGDAIVYKNTAGTQKWESASKNATVTGQVLCNTFLFDKYTIDPGSGSARLNFILNDDLSPGIWTVNASLARDDEAVLYSFPSLYFILHKKL